MFSRPLAILLLALAVLTAAAGGSYLATRHNVADAQLSAAAAPTATTPAAPTPAQAEAQPVAETESAVTPAGKEPAEPAGVANAPAPRREEPRATPPPAKARDNAAAPKPVSRRTGPIAATTPAAAEQAAPPVAAPAVTPDPPKAVEPQPEPAHVPQFEDLILPASSVIGLQMESTLTTERARIEDRVDARVTRDVLAGGRVAIPAGSRVVGSVTVVERGGKVKERSRLGVRFHTLILADGSEVPMHTDAVFRDGESPAGDSAKKIGGAAVGGAIIGAILGGKKGAAIGGATGAAGGTAAVMQGDRNAATLSRGEVVTARLSSPVTITVERRE